MALLAAGGSFLAGGYLTLKEIESYQEQFAAYNVNISKDEPSAVWVILSVVGTVLDAAAIGKITKQLVNAGRTLNETGDLAKAQQALKEAGLDKVTEEKVMQALDAEAQRLKKALDEKTTKGAKAATPKEAKPAAPHKQAAAPEKAAGANKAEIILAEVEVIAGKKVWTGKKAEAFLDKHGANGMYIPGKAGDPGTLVIRESASHKVIMEELLHLEQHRTLGFKELSAADILRMENEAHDSLLTYAKNKGWPKEEVAQIKENQKYWREKTAEFERNPEAVEKELKGLSAKKFRSREAVQKKVEEILKPYVEELKAKFPKAKIGYRGSLAKDVRHSTGGKFDPDYFDVDAYIVDDDLAKLFESPKGAFRDARDLSIYEFGKMANQVEIEFKSTFLGYGKKNDIFTFRVWTYEEYHNKIIREGFRNL